MARSFGTGLLRSWVVDHREHREHRGGRGLGGRGRFEGTVATLAVNAVWSGVAGRRCRSSVRRRVQRLGSSVLSSVFRFQPSALPPGLCAIRAIRGHLLHRTRPDQIIDHGLRGYRGRAFGARFLGMIVGHTPSSLAVPRVVTKLPSHAPPATPDSHLPPPCSGWVQPGATAQTPLARPFRAPSPDFGVAELEH